jgi:glycosyltransferase involved in cell wall biosynthesis
MVKALTISVVTETFPPEVNGVAMTLTHLLTQLKTRGHTIHLVRPRQSREDHVPHLASDTLCVTGLPIPGYRDLTLGLPAGRALTKQWRNKRPDVIYIATEGPLGWSAAQVAARLGIPAVSGFHTQFHKYCQYYRVPWLQPLVYRYLTALHKKTRCTLVPTTVMRDEMHADMQPIEVLGRGIDTELFNPDKRCESLRREWGAGPHDKVYLYVGRLAREKNIGLAIDTFLKMKAISPSARLVLVGNGPEYVRLYSHHEGLIFVGTRVGDELARHYASADIFLFPSMSETFGNVVLEAMASGLGVVAFNQAAAGIHIRHGHNGMLASTSDEHAFISHSAILQHDHIYLASLRKEARRSIEGRTWQQIGVEFERILRVYAQKEVNDEPGECLAARISR